MKRLRATSFSLLLLAGCNGLLPHPVAPNHYVFLVDATASVIPASLDRAIKAIESESEQMHRGDCLTVLPILGDSDSIRSDEIVRACAPAAREAYDQDLKDFHEQFRERMQQEEHLLATHRSQKTDILGSLKVVDQEFALDNSTTRKTVVIFSDFIEEDGARNFAKSPDFANVESAIQLARELAKGSDNNCQNGMNGWTGIRVLLGGLESIEVPTLDENRREAIRRFWIAYFKELKTEPVFMTDGPGMSARFLSE